MGIEIFPGFPASEILYENDKVVGVRTGDMGVGLDGKQKAGFEAGIDIKAKYTILEKVVGVI